MYNKKNWGFTLIESKYGKDDEVSINNGSCGCTGGGTGTAYMTNRNQSTTGNEFGIYDMNGGTYENVMGAMYMSGNTKILLGSSEFDEETINGSDMTKYIDKYAFGTIYNDYSRAILGDATGETRGWKGDYGAFVNEVEGSWFIRGGNSGEGSGGGLFRFAEYKGGQNQYHTFRLAITGHNFY